MNVTKVHWLIRQVGRSKAWNVFYAALLTEAIEVTVSLKLDWLIWMGLKLDPCFWHIHILLSQESSSSKSEKVHHVCLYCTCLAVV